MRARVLEALERRAKQFKSYENIWPFRIPHEPLALADIIDETLAQNGGLPPDSGEGHEQAGRCSAPGRSRNAMG